jgi:prophage DNA circulation protein
MAWSETLFDAEFNDVKFEVLATDDTFSWDLVEHETLYTAGAELEDLGEKARRYVITAIIYGDDYEIDRDKLLAALALPGIGLLIHPLYGSIFCKCKTATLKSEADRRDACILQLLFIEHKQEPLLFSQPAPSAAANAAQDAAEEADNALNDAVVASPNFETLINNADDAPGFFESAIAALAEFAGEVAPILLEAQAIWQDAKLLRAFVQRQYAQMAPDAAQNAASQKLGGFNAAGAKITRAVNRPSTPTHPARRAIEFVCAATALAHIAADLLGDEAANPTLSPPELAHIADTSRRLIQAAIKQIEPDSPAQSTSPIYPALSARIARLGTIRPESAALLAADLLAVNPQAASLNDATLTKLANLLAVPLNARLARITRPPWPLTIARPVSQALRNLAYQIQSAQIAALNQRPPLIIRKAPLSGNLTLVAHAWYGDASRAGELGRLNPSVINPNFIERDQLLSAYPK